MKKILLAIAMLAISTFAMFGTSVRNSEEVKTRIETVVFGKGNDLVRSPVPYELEAYLITRTGEVEVNLFGLGFSEVYIIDSYGQTVDYSYVNTDTPTTEYLSTSGPAYYSVVIFTDTYYAEGHFMIP